jgi:hypothetical protein
MRRLHQSGAPHLDLTTIGAELAKSGKVHFTGKLKVHLEQAKMAGVLTMSGKGNSIKVRLVPSLLAQGSVNIQPPQTNPGVLPGIPLSYAISSNSAPPAMVALVAVIAQLTGNPKGSALLTEIGAPLKKHKDGDFKKAGFHKLKDLVDAAKERGLVAATGSPARYLVRVL